MVDTEVIETCWDKAEWAYELLEPGIWRSTFATEREEDFDIYVMLGVDGVHFAVSPLVHGSDATARAAYHATLLAANQRVRLARFAVDADGDTNLLADIPAKGFDCVAFEHTLEILVGYTDELAHELHRLAHEPGYHSPKLAVG